MTQYRRRQAFAGAGPWPPHVAIREVLDVPGMAVAAGDDGDGSYLLVLVADRGITYCICAPATATAIDCVRRGRTSPWTVVRHSATGTVEVWGRRADGGYVDSLVTCSAIRMPAGAAA